MSAECVILNVLNRGLYAEPSTTVVEPLGCLYLIAAAHQRGYEVELKDFQVLFECGGGQLTLQEVWEASCAGARTMLGLSCMSHTLPLGLVLAEYHRTRYPECTIVFGGAGPSTSPEKLLERFPFIDYVVKGEGEAAFLSILDRIGHRGNPGQAPAARGVVTGQLVDMDQLPFPDRRLVASDRYETCIQSSRGCPHSCAFCSSKVVWGNHVRRRSPGNVVQEIREVTGLIDRGTIKRDHAYQMSFVDDTFVSDVHWLEEFRRILGQNRLRCGFLCYARLEELSTETLELLVSLGCNKLHIGVESGSPQVLGSISTKCTDRKRVVRTCAKAMEIVGCVSASFIYGFPFEKLDDVRSTMDLLCELDGVGAETLINPWMPLTGSDLVRRYPDDYELDEHTIVQQLECHYLTPDVVERTMQYVRCNQDMFLNFCVHRDSQMKEKRDLVHEHSGI